MEMKNNWRESYYKRNGTKDMLIAIAVASLSVGLIIGALSISLVDTLAKEPGRIITVNYELNGGQVTLDPVLSPNVSLLVTIPQTDQFKSHSMRLAEVGEYEPPFVPRLTVEFGMLQYLDYSQSEYIEGQFIDRSCKVISGSVTKKRYQLLCEE